MKCTSCIYEYCCDWNAGEECRYKPDEVIKNGKTETEKTEGE